MFTYFGSYGTVLLKKYEKVEGRGCIPFQCFKYEYGRYEYEYDIPTCTGTPLDEHLRNAATPQLRAASRIGSCILTSLIQNITDKSLGSISVCSRTILIYSNTSLNRPLTVVNSFGSFREVVDL